MTASAWWAITARMRLCWLSRRQTAASLRSLTAEIERARAAALGRAFEQLSPLSANDREVLDAMTHALARAVLQRVGEPYGTQPGARPDPI
jgi:glutamyl-tRNA reductase